MLENEQQHNSLATACIFNFMQHLHFPWINGMELEIFSWNNIVEHSINNRTTIWCAFSSLAKKNLPSNEKKGNTAICAMQLTTSTDDDGWPRCLHIPCTIFLRYANGKSLEFYEHFMRFYWLVLHVCLSVYLLISVSGYSTKTVAKQVRVRFRWLFFN